MDKIRHLIEIYIFCSLQAERVYTHRFILYERLNFITIQCDGLVINDPLTLSLDGSPPLVQLASKRLC